MDGVADEVRATKEAALKQLLAARARGAVDRRETDRLAAFILGISGGLWEFGRRAHATRNRLARCEELGIEIDRLLAVAPGPNGPRD